MSTEPGQLQKIDEVLANQYAVVHHGHTTLLLDGKTGFLQFISERVLVDLFQEPCAEHGCHGQSAAYDSLRHRVQHRTMRVHFHSFTTLQSLSALHGPYET